MPTTPPTLFITNCLPPSPSLKTNFFNVLNEYKESPISRTSVLSPDKCTSVTTSCSRLCPLVLESSDSFSPSDDDDDGVCHNAPARISRGRHEEEWICRVFRLVDRGFKIAKLGFETLKLRLLQVWLTMIVEEWERVVVVLLLFNVVQVSWNMYLECKLAMPALIWPRQVRVSLILNNVTGASTIVMYNSIPLNVLELGPSLVWG